MTYSVNFSAYPKNLFSGLSSLQQNEEFVDMTLAADGHLVKVHQILVALASPYLKALIRSAQCPHPVIFLNQLSYTTLCSLLEYIYTGEVKVPVDSIKQFLEAGKALQIKGLEDVNTDQHMGTITDPRDNTFNESIDDSYAPPNVTLSSNNPAAEETSLGDGCEIADNDDNDYDAETTPAAETTTMPEPKGRDKINIQYTVSNQGSLQMILNRYVYYVKHFSKNNRRHWRCVDYINSKTRCPAIVVTKDDMVLQRISAHNHSYHDKKILKKNKMGSIFSATQDAEREGENIKNKITSSK